MKRFFNNEEPDENFFNLEEEEEYIFGDEDEEIISAYIDKQDLINVMNIDIAESELNQNLLAQAIKISERNILWKFLSNKTKIKSLQTTYDELKKIISTEMVENLDEKTKNN